MNKCLGCVRGQAATNETELPQLEETGLAYGRDVVSHTELCVEENTKVRHAYINLWLRYNDFWFEKTNVHHIGILLPVPISTIFP